MSGAADRPHSRPLDKNARERWDKTFGKQEDEEPEPKPEDTTTYHRWNVR